jgi:hypothetical protein
MTPRRSWFHRTSLGARGPKNSRNTRIFRGSYVVSLATLPSSSTGLDSYLIYPAKVVLAAGLIMSPRRTFGQGVNTTTALSMVTSARLTTPWSLSERIPWRFLSGIRHGPNKNNGAPFGGAWLLSWAWLSHEWSSDLRHRKVRLSGRAR